LRPGAPITPASLGKIHAEFILKMNHALIRMFKAKTPQFEPELALLEEER
jgi:hypothetical protein